VATCRYTPFVHSPPILRSVTLKLHHLAPTSVFELASQCMYSAAIVVAQESIFALKPVLLFGSGGWVSFAFAHATVASRIPSNSVQRHRNCALHVKRLCRASFRLFWHRIAQSTWAFLSRIVQACLLHVELSCVSSPPVKADVTSLDAGAMSGVSPSHTAVSAKAQQEQGRQLAVQPHPSSHCERHRRLLLLLP